MKNNTLPWIIIAVLVGVFMVYFVSNSEIKSVQTTENNLQKTTMTDEEASQIIQHLYVKNPSFSIAVREGEDYYIVASISDGKYNEPRLLVLKQVADLWQEQTEVYKIICGTLECPTDVRRVKIGNSYYVYFVTESYGTSAGTVVFNLFSPFEMQLYSMTVSGGNGNINQLGTVSDDIKSNIKIYDYLTEQIASSPKIAHISQQNLDINSPENAVKKWQLDNEYVRTGMMNNAAPVKFTYYNENLMNIWEGTSITGTIENDRYKFVAYFKGVVIGLDKITNKYFIAWVPSDMYEWPIDLSFLDSNIIYLNSANSGPSLIINLNTNTISAK